jgi:hypothetical protein
MIPAHPIAAMRSLEAGIAGKCLCGARKVPAYFSLKLLAGNDVAVLETVNGVHLSGVPLLDEVVMIPLEGVSNPVPIDGKPCTRTEAEKSENSN